MLVYEFSIQGDNDISSKTIILDEVLNLLSAFLAFTLRCKRLALIVLQSCGFSVLSVADSSDYLYIGITNSAVSECLATMCLLFLVTCNTVYMSIFRSGPHTLTVASQVNFGPLATKNRYFNRSIGSI